MADYIGVQKDDQRRAVEEVLYWRRVWDHNKDLGEDPAFLANPAREIGGAYGAMNEQARKSLLNGVRPDPTKVRDKERGRFVSLVIGTPSDVLDQVKAEGTLFSRAQEDLDAVQRFVFKETGDEGQFNWQYAHMTIRSCADEEPDDEQLERFASLARPVVQDALAAYPDTRFYATGLVFDIGAPKGLSVCVKFFTSTPLVQFVRGGLALAWEKHRAELPSLRPMEHFHTRLQHWSILRFRQLQTWPSDFPQRLFDMVTATNEHFYGTISGLQLADFELRLGQSDALRTVKSIRLHNAMRSWPSGGPRLAASATSAETPESPGAAGRARAHTTFAEFDERLAPYFLQKAGRSLEKANADIAAGHIKDSRGREGVTLVTDWPLPADLQSGIRRLAARFEEQLFGHARVQWRTDLSALHLTVFGVVKPADYRPGIWPLDPTTLAELRAAIPPTRGFSVLLRGVGVMLGGGIAVRMSDSPELADLRARIQAVRGVSAGVAGETANKIVIGRLLPPLTLRGLSAVREAVERSLEFDAGELTITQFILVHYRHEFLDGCQDHLVL